MTSSTPEPELNVEAEKLKQSIIGRLRMYSDAGTWEEDESVRVILALIQQVSDQRVREFAKELEKHVWDIDLWQLSGLKVVSAGTIQRTLADYLGHKETGR